jgi:hypothetical protein
MAPPAHCPSPTFPSNADAEFNEQVAHHESHQMLIWMHRDNQAALRTLRPSPPLPSLGLMPLGCTCAKTGSTAGASTTGTTSHAPIVLAFFRGQRSQMTNRWATLPSGQPLTDPVPPRVASPSGGDVPSAPPRVASPSGGDSQPGGAPAADPSPPAAANVPDKANVIPLEADVVSPSLAAIALASEFLEMALQDHADAGTLTPATVASALLESQFRATRTASPSDEFHAPRTPWMILWTTLLWQIISRLQVVLQSLLHPRVWLFLTVAPVLPLWTHATRLSFRLS